MRYIKFFMLVMLLILGSCRESDEKTSMENIRLWEPHNDSVEIVENSTHEKERMRFKLLQSRILDKNEVFGPLYDEVKSFSKNRYEALKPLILERNILEIQQSVEDGKLSYEELTLFFLSRIYTYELNNETTLNTVIALNSEAVESARKKDKERLSNPSAQRHPIFGMPVLLKDNINTREMFTTAGAVVLEKNKTEDSFIVSRLKENGAILLGKVNLSEWAYFLCSGCPLGYSAVGGQTLNPYGRRIFETGGSSAGSGTAMAASYAVAAVGTETSGSILSPSSQNSIVGLKPTIGLLSRSGIVPISSTLDTPGPMTRNVVDTGILLDAMRGFDEEDEASVRADWDEYWYLPQEGASLKGKRLGVMQNLLEGDSIYRLTVDKLRDAGAEIITYSPPEVALDGFITLLNMDMKQDLPKYINTSVLNKDVLGVRSVADIVEFNKQDTLVRIPYGQALFEGIVADSTSLDSLEIIKKNLQLAGRKFFNEPWNANQLDAVLSINNYHAGYAAVAKYPALTLPMGYRESGEPVNMTFIAKQFQEEKLLELGAAFETLIRARKSPRGYSE